MSKIENIAEYTILRLNQNGQSICPLKLQKLLYYIQAWHLVYFNSDIFAGEQPEAWVNGPVYRCIYNIYRKIGIYDTIGLEALGLDSSNLESVVKAKRDSLELSDDQNDFLEAIFKHYGSMSHDRLVFLTHSERPWNSAREGLSAIDYSRNKISIEEMKEYYSTLSEK